jgi:hypothetical protein
MTWLPNSEEALLDLQKDGGRRVMYGGDPYEDDLEPAAPAAHNPLSGVQSPPGEALP